MADEIEQLEIPGVGFGFSVQGTRLTQEDRMILLKLPGNVVVAGVFDGHGGDGASQVLKELVPSVLVKYLDDLEPGKSEETRNRAWKTLFDELEELLQADERVGTSGSTAVIAVVFRDEKFLTIAHCGDSLASLVIKNTIEEETEREKSNMVDFIQREAKQLDDRQFMEMTCSKIISCCKDLLDLLQGELDVSVSLWRWNELTPGHGMENTDERDRLAKVPSLKSMKLLGSHYPFGVNISRAFGDKEKKK